MCDKVRQLEAQLAEAVGLLRKKQEYLESPYPYGAYSYGLHGTAKAALMEVQAFLARHAQGAQAVDERAAFEDVCRKTAIERCGECSPEALRKRPDGTYVSIMAQCGWWAWQARAALATQPVADDHDQAHQLAFEVGEPDEDGDGYHFSAEQLDEFVAKLNGAALAIQPAYGEPVAWVTDGKEIDCAYKDLEPGGRLPTGTKLYAVPPAAAHGDEAVRFELADVVAVSREDLLAMSGDVCPSTGRSEMECLLGQWLKGHDIPVFRKRLFTMRAQAGEGGEK